MKAPKSRQPTSLALFSIPTKMFQINLFFICNVIRVLYSKVRESNNTSEAGLKKSVKAAMMLLPLLGVPNIMQTIPFAPTRDNIMVRSVFWKLLTHRKK